MFICTLPHSGSLDMTDLTGMTFGRLTVVAFHDKTQRGVARWRCRCQCGNETVTSGADMKRRPHASCGCRQRERARETQTKHGLCNTPEYVSWQNMRSRCLVS